MPSRVIDRRQRSRLKSVVSALQVRIHSHLHVRLRDFRPIKNLVNRFLIPTLRVLFFSRKAMQKHIQRLGQPGFKIEIAAYRAAVNHIPRHQRIALRMTEFFPAALGAAIYDGMWVDGNFNFLKIKFYPIYSSLKSITALRANSKFLLADLLFTCRVPEDCAVF